MSSRYEFLSIIAGLTLVFLVYPPTSEADQEPEVAGPIEAAKTRRPSFSHEQCVIGTRKKFDEMMARCLKPRRSVTDEESGQCVADAREKFSKSLEKCPADSGR